MGKKSRTKRERREGKLASEAKPVSLFDTMTTVPADMLITSLVLKFVGKSGYRYISIGRFGSLFVNELSQDIVPVELHREFPELSVRGRYNDPNRNDIVLYAVHVPRSFPGLVINKHAQVFLTGNPETPASEEEIKNVLCDLTKVTGEEFNNALNLERPLMEASMKKLHDEVEAAAKAGVKDINKAEQDLKIAEATLRDPYGNDPYGNLPVVEELPISDTEVVDAEVVE